MNHTPSGFLPSDKAIEGFLYFKMAEGLSEQTLVNYRRYLKIWLERLGDLPLWRVSSSDLNRHIVWLKTEYQPIRKNGDTSPMASKTLRNHWAALKSFFRWLSLEFGIANAMDRVPSPKFNTPPVTPPKEEEIKALIRECKYKRRADPMFRRSFKMRRPTARRDEATILILLDTGLRAAEYCALNIEDINFKSGHVDIKHGPAGGAKGGKGRAVFVGRITRKTIWRYLSARKHDNFPETPLFLNNRLGRMTPNSLRHVIKSIAAKAGIENCYPHRFRHTFAISYLRSGGDVFTLQAILGHKSLEMVRHYARIAEIDIARVHRRASPVDNLRI